MRWNLVIPALIVALAITAFNIFFFDGILKSAMIAVGQKVFAAKVEIAGVKTKFTNLSVTIAGVRVADRTDPWKNLFEMDSVRFAVRPLPLLSKKVLIDEMALEGVQWGTQRKTSGALPPARVAKIDKQNEKESGDSATGKLLAAIKQKASSEFAALPSVQTITDAQKGISSISVDDIVKAAGLSAPREIEAMRAGLDQKYKDYQARIENLNAQDAVKRAQKTIADAQNIKIDTPADIADAQAKIQALNNSKNELQGILNEAKSLQSSLSTDIGRQADLVNRINELKDKDVQKVQSMLKLPSLSLGNVSYALFGPAWVSRVERFVHYADTARKYMPPRKKEDDRIVKKRARGTVVSFPKYNVPPDFLIRRITLSGSTGGPGKEGTPLDFSGTIENVTSDPVLLGSPVIANINGSEGNRRLVLKGTFDHTRDIGVDSIHLEYAGLDARNLGLPNSEYLPSFEKGMGTLTTDFTLKGGALDSGLRLLLGNIEANPNVNNRNPEVASLVTGLWSGISSLSVSAAMSGTPEGLTMSVTSDIDKILVERMKKLYGEKLEEAQARIRAEVDRLTGDAQEKLLAEYGGRRDELLKQLNVKQGEIQGQMNAAQEETRSKENEVRGQGEREKKKAEEELKRKAQEELRKRLGF